MDRRKHAGPLPGACRAKCAALQGRGSAAQRIGSAQGRNIAACRRLAQRVPFFLALRPSVRLADSVAGPVGGASGRDRSACMLQELGLDPIVANLELDRVNPHLRQLAKATQGNTLAHVGSTTTRRCRACWPQPSFSACVCTAEPCPRGPSDSQPCAVGAFLSDDTEKWGGRIYEGGRWAAATMA